MKKLLFLLFFIPVLSFSQYSKKELKKLKKMELKIVNRGLDLKETFVPYCIKKNNFMGTVESSWAEAMFTLGLDVGDYSSQKQIKDSNNRETELSRTVTFNGRYVFDSNAFGVIKILDLYNDNKIVATIRYKGSLNYGAGGNDLYFKKEYVIKELIKSNR